MKGFTKTSVLSEKEEIMDKKSSAFLWRQRISYGSADFACNLIWQMISLYLLYYYTDIAKLDGLQIASMFIVCRIIDGITDLLIGYAIDKTNTKWGKSRPYFLWGAIPFAVFAYLAFSVPDSFNQLGKLIYCYITYIGLSFMYTVVNIPMASILPALTDDPHERTNLATTRQFFGFLGSTLVASSGLYLVDLLGNGNEGTGFKYVMFIFGIIGSLIFFFTFFNLRENNRLAESSVGLMDSLRSLRSNRPWKIFAFNILFMWGTYFLQSGALVFYYISVVGSKPLSITVATISSLLPVISNLSVPFLSKLTSKRNLFVSSSIVQIIGMLIIGFAGKNVTGILTGASISALAMGIKMSIYFSMQADPVDYGIWKTGIDTAGSLSAINGFLGKVAQAIAGGISGFLIAWGGYQGGQTSQSESALQAISGMYLFIPIIMTVISVIIMSFYKLDKLQPQIQKDLAERKLSK